ncbi:DUF1828 domain-containing protein [Staphylococcus condimenti]|uniref:DUF1828 domain-containing protein n=1 Tax=Staphylococcus condimenti TaxID=70255 RepID=A0AB37H823_9STAP|nr:MULTISPECIES: DUF1828 domain-containing protein [Staphylococcus]AMY06052.1 hypothetical protein A4G25_08985 [Staphylococcus condimenti]APR59929.1 hypothetical protein BTZ13_01370 [Staphylococcus condimenti]MDK8646186.1 DUF1828 domain-containing protein [Staphylococcus condimenti]OFO99840.1 hypothetical protein HMPREF3007_05640 [Staphylococcus sp. HMSC065E08]PNZ59429.1 DUF1828 domain-containing protein [Staphylococcus condimenti]
MKIIEEKMDEYFKWLKQNYKYKQLDNSTEITTPFVNHLNDAIRIYLDFLPNKKIRLSDDGLTFNELELFGIDINTKTRRKLIESILNQFALRVEDEEIIADINNKEFAQAKHNMIQGILKIYDLTLTAKPNVSNLFYEEVYSFLFEEEIVGTNSVSISGESGIKYTIDFIVPPTKTKPEVLIDFANNLDFNKITSDSFAFRDVKNSRLSRNNQFPKMNVIANDIDNPITERVRQAANYEDIKILNWSDKESIVNLLKR